MELTATAKRRSAETPKLVHLIRGDLDWIVMKCLEKDRTRRYETANGLAADIERHLNERTRCGAAAQPVVPVPKDGSAKQAGRDRRTDGAGLPFRRHGGLGLARRATRCRGRAAVASEQRARLAQRTAEENGAAFRHQLYLARMNLIQAAWEETNIERVRQLLKDTADSPERGFEWYYRQRSASESRLLQGHRGCIYDVRFSPDGRRIASGSADMTVKLWDTATGKNLLTFSDHTDQVLAVAFSPDSQRVASTGRDRTASVWDAVNGRTRLTMDLGAPAACIAFSPDGRRIVTGSEDHTAKVWDAGTGARLLTLTGHSNEVSSIAFSPEGIES